MVVIGSLINNANKNQTISSSQETPYIPEAPEGRYFDIDELLKSKIGAKDKITLKLLYPGDEVYICRVCQLAYLKESWEYLEGKCERRDCPGSQGVKLYKLPGEIKWENL